MTDDNLPFLQHILRPVLSHLNWDQKDLEALLLGAAIAGQRALLHYESTNSACGCGIYNITPNLHRSVWDQYLAFQPELASRVRGLASQHQFLLYPDLELITNLAYTTAIAASVLKWINAWPQQRTGEAFMASWRKAIKPENAQQEDELLIAYRGVLAESTQLHTA